MPRSSVSSKVEELLERRNSERLPTEQNSRTWKLSDGEEKAENMETIFG
jgi:hypothetical protein